MKTKYIVWVIMFFLWNILPVYAQNSEGIVLRPLTSNPVLEQISTLDATPNTKQSVEPIVLPFFDDFTYSGPYPKANIWADKKVFVNNTYPLFPPTYGVATFDALDEKGQLYPQALPGRSFSADTLKSNPIRLDSVFFPVPRALGVEDSIILSFYYQPGGGWGNLWEGTRRGVTPYKTDRLSVEFYSQELSIWIEMWSTDGMSLKEFCPLLDSADIQDIDYFRRVEVPITTPGFNKKDFQFRFRAYSSVDKDLKTGGGQWHIDYVYLNYGRVKGDSYMDDVSFVDVTNSVTTPYSIVPKRQFSTELLKDKFNISMTNLSRNILSCRYRYYIRQAGTTNILYAQPQAGEVNANIYPFSDRGYTTDPDLSKMDLSYDFEGVKPEGEDIAYEIEHIVKSGIQGDFNQINDTIRVYQSFGNEYAYDDGSSEAGIGLTYPDGIMAYSFRMYNPDTLTALNIFFNGTYGDINKVAFTICVWKAKEDPSFAGGFIPGDKIYESSFAYPVFEEGINKFYTYNIDDRRIVLPQGVFFVGIRQLGKTFMNVGFDQNTDAKNYLLYYYLDAQSHEWAWKETLYSGALMLRPAFGEAARTVGNEDNCFSQKENNSKYMCKVYPNPATAGEINIILPNKWNANRTMCTITSFQGNVIFDGSYRSNLSIENIKAGLYLIRLYDTENGEYVFAKLIIN